MHEDALAVEAVKAGDRERYAELVRRYERLVHGIVWSRLGHRELCEEAAQETFLHGFRFLAALRSPEKYGSWVARIARNVAETFARRRRRELENERRWFLERGSQRDSDRVAAPGQPRADTLQDVLRQLPQTYRECLVLYYLQERDIGQCAGALGITEGAFKVRLHRARNALRAEMQARLEGSLRNLGPGEGLAGRVLSAAPAMPLACGAATVTGIGCLLLKAALQLAPLLLLLRWQHRQTVESYRDAQDYRKIMQRRHWPRHVAMMVLATVLGAIGWRCCGAETMGLVLAAFCLVAVFKGFLLLRVNSSGFTRASVLGMMAMLLAFVVQAVKGSAYYWAFMAAMLLYNIALWAGRKSMPVRGDYHIALRAAFGELGRRKAADHAPRMATPQDMRRFARLMGSLFLVVDYSRRGNECLMAMPPMTLDPWRLMWPWREFAWASRLTVRSDGTCGVALCAKDWDEINALCLKRGLSRQEVERRAAEAVELAWAAFLSGDEERAKSVLQPKPDVEIFHRAVHGLRSMKVIYAVAIVTTLIGFAVSLWYCAATRWGLGQSGRPVSHAESLQAPAPVRTGTHQTPEALKACEAAN